MAQTRAQIGRMMSSRIQVTDRMIQRNKTQHASITQVRDEETKGNTNSQFWGDLGAQSTTQSQVISNSALHANVHQILSQERLNTDALAIKITSIVDNLLD